MSDKMIAMRSLSSRLHWRHGALLLLGAVGCGLLSSDITKVTFDLPTKTYSFDTSQWGLPANSTPPVPCGGGPTTVQDCCNPPALPGVTKPDCVAHPLVCEGTPMVCTLEQPVTVSQTMNLKNEVPELSSVNSQSLVDISLQNLHYDAVSTLNVDVPPLELFLAPDMVTDPKDARAMKFGTVPAIAKGTSPSGDVVLEPGADALFAGYGHAFGTPFNFIASTTVSVPSGSPTPTGMITVTVTGKVAAKL
jgi:hypothetical protein